MDSNDQILCINDIYLTESSSNINKALSNLFDTNQRYYKHKHQQRDQDTNINDNNNNNHNLRRLDLLISRDINTKLIKKHSKKPSLYFNTKNFKAFVTKSISNTSLSSNSSSITTISTTTASCVLNTNSLLSAVVNSNSNFTSTNNTTGEDHHSSSLYKNPIKLSSSSSSLLLNNFKCNTEEILNKKLNQQLLRKNKQKFSSYLIYDLNNDSLRYIIKSSINNNSSNTSTIRDSTTSKQTFNSINNKNQMILKDMMVLNTEWTQLETIELLNESSSSCSTSSSSAISKIGPAGAKATTLAPPGSVSSGVGAHGSGGGGFGFGITGNKSTGVVVKAITPGGSAQRVFILHYFFSHFVFIIF